jgi:hypothetical protein
MRFKRLERTPFFVTDRKRAAAARMQQKQRDAVPLLAALVAEQQPSIDAVMTTRIQRWGEIQQNWRNTRAGSWRKARAALDALPAEIRAAMLRYWNAHSWLPGDPSYLSDAIHGLRTGRLICKDGQIVPARITISAAEADAVQITRKPIAKGWLVHSRRA